MGIPNISFDDHPERGKMDKMCSQKKECSTNYHKHRISIVLCVGQIVIAQNSMVRSMVIVGGSWPMGKKNDHYVDLVSWISGTHTVDPRGEHV